MLIFNDIFAKMIIKDEFINKIRPFNCFKQKCQALTIDTGGWEGH